MTPFELLQLNLLSPMVLCFALGMVSRFLKSDLSLPESVYTALAAYLLLAIGLKGGVALSVTPLREVIFPVIVTMVLGCVIPLITFYLCRRGGGFSVADAGAMACHYGSVSAVTFIASQTFLRSLNVEFEGYLPGLVALLEVPAIVVGLMLARSEMVGGGARMRDALREILTGKSIVLLGGGMAVGFLTGEVGYESVRPFFLDPFMGVLCLFLLDMGLLAASRLADLRRAGTFLAVFALVAPVVFGAMGVVGGWLAGMSAGGATVLGAMSASASYIAAPAAVRLALPQANPAYYLTSTVGITFPFNLALGIPLYYYMAVYLYS